MFHVQADVKKTTTSCPNAPEFRTSSHELVMPLAASIVISPTSLTPLFWPEHVVRNHALASLTLPSKRAHFRGDYGNRKDRPLAQVLESWRRFPLPA